MILADNGHWKDRKQHGNLGKEKNGSRLKLWEKELICSHKQIGDDK